MAIATVDQTALLTRLPPTQEEVYARKLESVKHQMEALERGKSDSTPELHAAILYQFIEEERELSRILQILRAGYEEIELHPIAGWKSGFPPDPSRYEYPAYVGLCTGTVTAAVFCAILSTLGLFSATGLTTAFLLLFCAISGLSAMACGKMNARALKARGLPTGGTHLFLQGKLPGAVQERVEEAQRSGLFTQVRMYAPEKAFHERFLGDPIVYGTAGEHTFLIAQFDLGKDLQCLVS